MSEIPQSYRKLKWIHITVLLLAAIGAAWVLIKLYPAYRDLVLFGLYSIPSHMLISPFPHEPVLLETAKYFPAWQIALGGTIGCCLAGFLDYWIITPLVNHRYIRPKLDNRRIFRKSLEYFYKFPFAILVFAAVSPIPFYPFKFLSIAGRYPLWKYQLALIVGRTPRYYVLAVLGHVLQIPTWVLAVTFVALLLSPMVKIVVSRLKKKRRVSPANGDSGVDSKDTDQAAEEDATLWLPAPKKSEHPL